MAKFVTNANAAVCPWQCFFLWPKKVNDFMSTFGAKKLKEKYNNKKYGTWRSLRSRRKSVKQSYWLLELINEYDTGIPSSPCMASSWWQRRTHTITEKGRITKSLIRGCGTYRVRKRYWSRMISELEKDGTKFQMRILLLKTKKTTLKISQETNDEGRLMFKVNCSLKSAQRAF